jgi:hypothetical protein
LQLIQWRRVFNRLPESEHIEANAGGCTNQNASHSASQNAVTCMHNQLSPNLLAANRHISRVLFVLALKNGVSLPLCSENAL